MKVIVFGATGGLGGQLLAELHGRHVVTAVVRGESQLGSVAAAGAIPCRLDLEVATPAQLHAALAGADAVVWAAGANLMTGPEHSDRVDRDAALRAVAAADTAGVGRWLQVSSLFANRWQAGPPVLHHFLANKALADDAITASALDWTIIRPGGLTHEPATGRVRIAPELDQATISRGDVAAVIAELLATGSGRHAAFDLGNDSDTPIRDAVAGLGVTQTQ